MLHFERKGHGKPVVFLHGFLESSTMWANFNLKEATFESILIDLPGHGKSVLTSGLSSISDVADSIIDLLKTIKIVEFDLVGHSLGGYVALEIHKKLKLQNKLILFHSNFWEDDEEKKANRNRVIKVVKENKSFFLNEAIPNLFLKQFRNTMDVQALIEEAKTISSETIILYSEMMRDRRNQTAYVIQNKEKVYVIQGELDVTVSLSFMLQHSNELSKLIIVGACGHMGHIEATKKTEKLVMECIFDTIQPF